MAYKYQLGDARMSGSLIQEGDITSDASGNLTIAGSSDLNGTLDVSGQVDLAATGVSTNVRGGLTVEEASLFSSLLQVDGTLDCNSTVSLGGEVTFLAGQKVKVTSVTSSTYTIVSADYFIAADSSSNTVTLTLLAASGNSGKVIKIKDVGGNAASNNITINRSASDTIDGSTSIVLESPYSGITLICNGSSWFIL